MGCHSWESSGVFRSLHPFSLPRALNAFRRAFSPVECLKVAYVVEKLSR